MSTLPQIAGAVHSGIGHGVLFPLRGAVGNLPDPEKRGKVNPPWVLIHRAADRRMSRIAKVIEKGVIKARNALDMQELEKAIETRIPANVEFVVGMALVTLEATTRKPLEEVLFTVLADAGKAVAKDARKFGRFRTAFEFSDLAFDLVNPEATAWASGRSSRLITNINGQTRTSVQTIIAQMFDEGVSGPGAARRIREVVGLTPRYAGAVDKLRRKMASAKPGAKLWAGKTAIRIPRGGATQEFIDRRANRYARRLLNVRSRNIARTEAIAAANQGQIQIWKQARGKGLLFGDELKEWIVTPDDRLCPICAPLSGEQVQLDESFSSGADSPPAHSSCRCTMGLADPNVTHQKGGKGTRFNFDPTQHNDLQSLTNDVRNQLGNPGAIDAPLGDQNAVVQFKFGTGDPEAIGAKALYERSENAIFFSDDTGENLLSLMAGRQNKDSWDGLTTVVHELGHSGSLYADTVFRGQFVPQGSLLWEEAVVENRAREIATRMMFPKKVPNWVAKAGTSYNQEVLAIKRLESYGMDLNAFYEANPAKRVEMIVGAVQKKSIPFFRGKGFTDNQIRHILDEMGELPSQNVVITDAFSKWKKQTKEQITSSLKKDFGVHP